MVPFEDLSWTSSLADVDLSGDGDGQGISQRQRHRGRGGRGRETKGLLLGFVHGRGQKDAVGSVAGQGRAGRRRMRRHGDQRKRGRDVWHQGAKLGRAAGEGDEEKSVGLGEGQQDEVVMD